MSESSSPSSSYTYDPLPSKTHIRLIRLNEYEGDNQISFTLTAHDLASPSTLPPFTALSYTWGAPGLNSSPEFSAHPDDIATTARSGSRWDKATHPVRCNGSSFLVRPNLFNALLTLHNEEDVREEMVWIDAICIDQGNIPEREDQVQLMGEIFGRATGILAWLGTKDEFTDDAYKVIQKLARVGKICNSEEEMELESRKYDWITSADLSEPEAYEKLGIEFITPHEWRAWFGFVLRPYFRRAWIVQEILKARKLDMVIHDKLIRWGAFSRAVHFLEQVRAWRGTRIIDEVLAGILACEDDSEPSRNEWHLALSLLRTGARRHVALALGGTRIQEKRGLDGLLEDHRDTIATDARDKVYALLGLTSDPLGDLVVDYGSPVEVVYTRTARNLCRLHKDLRIFAHRELNRHRNSKSLPSWVPEFSVSHKGGAMRTGTGGGKDWMASGGETWKLDGRLLEDKELQVRGRLLGVVESVSSRLLFKGKEDRRWQGWRDLLRLLHATLRPSEIQSQEYSSDSTASPLETLARTLTRDTLRGISPAPSADLAGQSFNFIIDQYLSSYGEVETTPEAHQIWEERRLQIADTQSSQVDDSSSIGDLLSVISRIEPEGSQYAYDTFMSRLKETIKYTMRENLVYFGERRKPATDAKIVELELPVLEKRAFSQQAEHSLDNRRIYSLMCGNMSLLALGPEDGAKGDDVWILDGAKTPVVLRKNTEGQFEFLGEAYVHGMMHGEALGRFPDVQEIVLV